MSKMKTIKGKAKTAEYTDYVAIKSNETRWNGSYRMVERYLKFHASLVEIVDDGNAIGREIARLLPTNLEHMDLKNLIRPLKHFHSVSLLLQKRDGVISLSDVRELFVSLIDDYGEDFMFYLSADAEIVSFPEFEKSIVKAIREENLGDADREQLKTLVINDNCDEVIVLDNQENQSDDMDYGLEVLKNARKKRKVAVANYINLKEVLLVLVFGFYFIKIKFLILKT
jgi:hypothetical protein